MSEVRLNLKEGETIEFKTSFQEKVIETLVAFANTQGGTVYIGVNDDGSVQGINPGKETFQKWLNEIKLKTQPSSIPSIKEIKEGVKSIAVIQVQEFPIKPLSFKGRYYKRVHNSNHQLSAMEITDLNLQSLQLSWDAYQKPGKTANDLAESKVMGFIEKVNRSGRFQLSGVWKKDLEKDNYQARTRNKLIAEAFYLTGEIEKYGSGFIRIRESLKDYPTMQLLIEEKPGGFFSELNYKQQKGSGDVVENVVEKDAEIIALIQENPKISARQMGRQMDVTERTIQRYLQSLIQQKIIKRQGSARGGKWVILKNK